MDTTNKNGSEQPSFMLPNKWTLLLTGDNHGLVGEFGSKWEGSPAQYPRVNVYAAEASVTPAAPDVAELGKLKALAEAATTHGAWKMIDIGGRIGLRVDSGYQCFFNTQRPNETVEAEARANAAFIGAASPAAILRIAALVSQQAARISVADRLLKAAKVYAFNYLQDERDDPELCGYGPKQHAEIVELWEAIEAQEGK